MIGRQEEFYKLKAAVDKDRAQLIVIYGRRRVGKTFIVNEFFENKFTFKHTAVSPFDENGKLIRGIMKIQLREFYLSMRAYGLDSSNDIPSDWFDAFFMLEQLLAVKDDGEKMILFIDELPWMDTPRSNFLPAFEHFCNNWCLARRNVKLVVCGSASSWILDKMVNSRGGMYRRVTLPIYVRPFTLRECEQLFDADGFHMDRYDILLSYMVFGGIPFYLDQFRQDLSVAQNINSILFGPTAPLKKEFDLLFYSQFTNHERLRQLVIFLSGKRIGYTRKEISQHTSFSSGGNLSDMLSALENSGIIASYVPFGGKDELYRVSDPFCRFYLKHVAKNQSNPTYWQDRFNSPSVLSWQGLAFEDVCLSHIGQIKQALGISGVITKESQWIESGDDQREGMQIDLVIDRNDRVINICEMKFSVGRFAVTKSYGEKIMTRIANAQEYTKNKKTVMSVLVTTYGLEDNRYSWKFQKVVTMDDLFRDV